MVLGFLFFILILINVIHVHIRSDFNILHVHQVSSTHVPCFRFVCLLLFSVLSHMYLKELKFP